MKENGLTLEEIGSWAGLKRDESISSGHLRLTHQSEKNRVMWHAIVNNYDKIIIIGYPRSGKSTLFDALVKQDDNPHFYLHTDNFKHHGFVEQLYIIITEIENKPRWIVEGIQGYRLLRKAEQLNRDELRPDLIVEVYNSAPPLQKHERMRKSLDTIWADYCTIREKKPESIIYFHHHEYEE